MVQIAGKPFTQLKNLNITGELRVGGLQGGPAGVATNSASVKQSPVTTTEVLATNLIDTPSEASVVGFTATGEGFKLVGVSEESATSGLFYARARYFIKSSSGTPAVIFDIAKKDALGNITHSNSIVYTFTLATTGTVFDIMGSIDLEIGDTIGVSVDIASGSTGVIFESGDFKVGELSSIE